MILPLLFPSSFVYIPIAPGGWPRRRQPAGATGPGLANLVLLQPSRSNDAGFAMTGSFSCMMLTALLVFDPAFDADKAAYVDQIAKMAETVLACEGQL